MGMGWKECNYSEETSRRKCSCGLGEIITYTNYAEESDYPPFYRGESTNIDCTCKNPKCVDFLKYNKRHEM